MGVLGGSYGVKVTDGEGDDGDDGVSGWMIFIVLLFVFR